LCPKWQISFHVRTQKIGPLSNRYNLDDNSFYTSRDHATENWQGERIEITVGKGNDRATKEQKLDDEHMNDQNTMKYKDVEEKR